VRERKYPPGPSNWRRVLLDIQKDPLRFLIQLQRDYGNFVHYRHGPAHVFFVNTPDLIREVLVTQNDFMQRTPIVHRSLGKFLGNGLLISSGMHHQHQRQLLQPLFTPSSVAGYDQLIISQTQKILAEWQNGGQRDLMPDMQKLTMDILYQAIFGVEDIRLGAEVRSAIGTLQSYTGEMLQRTPQIAESEIELAIQKFDAAFDTLLQQERKSNLLSLLLNSGMPIENVRNEIVTLMVAGQETSAHALTWLWYLLALHPDIQARLYLQIASGLKGVPLTADLLTQLPLIINAIRESLRYYPPAWLIGRSPTQTLLLNGYSVNPEGIEPSTCGLKVRCSTN
jgi:cytochrome P450